MRKSFYTLSGIVTNQMGMDIQMSDAFIFINKSCTSMKEFHMEYGDMIRFEKWLLAEYPKVLKGSPIEKAIYYTYKRFNKLSRYHLDGRYAIDNNGIENAVRLVSYILEVSCILNFIKKYVIHFVCLQPRFYIKVQYIPSLIQKILGQLKIVRLDLL